jgi:hypothetical protein
MGWVDEDGDVQMDVVEADLLTLAPPLAKGLRDTKDLCMNRLVTSQAGLLCIRRSFQKLSHSCTLILTLIPLALAIYCMAHITIKLNFSRNPEV